LLLFCIFNGGMGVCVVIIFMFCYLFLLFNVDLFIEICFVSSSDGGLCGECLFILLFILLFNV
jgi:hypothetical protein